MKIEIEKKDIVEYFDNMNCKDCPFNEECDITETANDITICGAIMTNVEDNYD